jgi:hypothetical protein
MNHIFKEYGSMIVGVLGMALLLTIFRQSFFQSDGLLARMIITWGNGGF